MDLVKEISMEEIERALKHMGSFKELGPNWYQAIFYKRAWHIVGEAVHHFVKKMHDEGAVPVEAVEATLVLIPKGVKPSNMCGFRLLSLCNVTYKLASKIIVNRLKDIMKELISPCQDSFFPGREAQ